MTRSAKASIGIAIVAVVGTVAMLLVAASQQFSVVCEVCVGESAQPVCQTATGETEKEALHTAQDSACGLWGGSRAKQMVCNRREPVSQTCDL